MNQKILVVVKVVEARDISPVENKGELLDAFAQIRLGEHEFKTAVCRRSTCPVWREEIFRFEIDDKTLNDEPLQVRLMDHEAYSANDTVGGLLFNLVNLLNIGHPYRLDGWLPLLDPVHGIRGEIHLIVKLDMQSRIARPVSLCVLNTPIPPLSPKVLQLFGVVDDVLVEADPETEWRDKLRSARASDDVRQLIIARLAIELQQRITSRAFQLGGNAVIGYRQIVESDGIGGLIARAIGTAVWLDQGVISIPPGVVINSFARSHFSLFPDSPFFTLTSYPPGIISHIGGMITARAVRCAGDNRTSEMYRRWFSELKQELKLQLSSAGYDTAIGYREQISVWRELIIVSVTATTASLGRVHGIGFHNMTKKKSPTKCSDREKVVTDNIDDGVFEGGPAGNATPCSIFHVPRENATPGLSRCQRGECPIGWVPQILLCSVDPPPDVSVCSSSGLIRACVSRQRRRDVSFEVAAKEVSELLPHLEHELYREMQSKMRRGRWNSVFNLDIQLTIGEDLIILTATGSGMCLKMLPSPNGRAPPSPESPSQVSNTSFEADQSASESQPLTHLSSFALIYRIPSNHSTINWPERILQLVRFRNRKLRISALGAVQLRLMMSSDQAHWLLMGAALGQPPVAQALQRNQQSSTSLSTSMLSTITTPTITNTTPSSRVISTVLPSLLPSYATKRHLFRLCITVVRECEDLAVVVAESLELLRAFAALFGATAVLSVHIDLCQAAERQSIVVVSGDAAVVTAVQPTTIPIPPSS